MAEGIYSNWKITFDPAGAATVLVDIGDKLASEVVFRASRGAELIDLVDSAAPFLRDQKNASATITIQHFKDSASDALARQSLMEGMISVLSPGKKPLKVEAKGVTDRYWLFTECIIRSFSPDRYMEAPVARLLKGYDIVAVKLTQVGP